ncbi:13066_t:CDS:2 [Gigaspora margarita]|uniref:13066_t:CDS:1 n=1 Tax=Gigaspora margarita TaxID=4874 RepID=A0ABN7W153_GIGMA|nr:13066_t:CDS:2 [Gigaspora margarita]
MAEKFHIGAYHIYEIWEHYEYLQQGLDNQNDFSSPPDSNEGLILDKSQTKEILAKETSTKKISQKKKYAQILFDISRREANLEKLIKDTERLAPICSSLPQ